MATKDPREPFTRIDVKEADDMMKDGAEVVDVREPHEYTAGHVPGAKLIPVNSVYARREELPRDKNLIFVCAVGQRSAESAGEPGDQDEVYEILLARTHARAASVATGICMKLFRDMRD